MTTIRIQVAPRVGPANPRGARVAAALVVALLSLLARLGRKAAPRGRTPAEEAQEVREMALAQQAMDPRFAAELFAAADRHERLHGLD